jgi:hypothetical protein
MQGACGEERAEQERTTESDEATQRQPCRSNGWPLLSGPGGHAPREGLLPMRRKHRRHARLSRRPALVSPRTSRRCYAKACARTPSARPHVSKADAKVVVASATLLIPYLSRTTTKIEG